MQTVLHAAFVRGGDMFFDLKGGKRSSPGREHLVDFERSEKIYLVIRDHKLVQKKHGVASSVFRESIKEGNLMRGYQSQLFLPFSTEISPSRTVRPLSYLREKTS